GVFVSPIDFRLLPGTYLHDKTRFRIPISRIDPATACLTYEWEGKRSRLPLTAETLADAAALWTEERVRSWFAKDQSKVFYYVPQLMVYPVDGIPIESEDIEYFD
ncbi:MAG: hypothetical protein GY943_15115, partial [Chloroflexi bacterium]|nr:hypothetical protein [Chloroflexota bacterium]